jgi:hypothetical protein
MLQEHPGDGVIMVVTAIGSDGPASHAAPANKLPADVTPAVDAADQLRRAAAALTAAGLHPGPPISATEHYGTGDAARPLHLPHHRRRLLTCHAPDAAYSCVGPAGGPGGPTDILRARSCQGAAKSTTAA